MLKKLKQNIQCLEVYVVHEFTSDCLTEYLENLLLWHCQATRELNTYYARDTAGLDIVSIKERAIITSPIHSL